MIVTLIKHQKISGIVLPEKVSGQYSLKDTDALGSRTEFLNIEGIGGKWMMKSNKAVHILDHENRPVKNFVLEPLNVYNLEIAGFDYKACVFTEPVTQRRQMFTKVFAGSDDTRIAIGRNESNDIVFSSGFVSASHARLAYH